MQRISIVALSSRPSALRPCAQRTRGLSLKHAFIIIQSAQAWICCTQELEWTRRFTDKLTSTCKLVTPSIACGQLEGTLSVRRRLWPMAEVIDRPVPNPFSGMFATDKVCDLLGKIVQSDNAQIHRWPRQWHCRQHDADTVSTAGYDSLGKVGDAVEQL